MRKGAAGHGWLRTRRWAWAPLAAGVVGCAGAGGPSPPDRAVARAETYWLPYLQGGEAGNPGVNQPGELRGKLFVLRIDDRSLTTSTWVKCPMEGWYRYEALGDTPKAAEFSKLEDAARFLPQGYQFFTDALSHGGVVRIRYVVAGRYVLTGGQARTAGVVCNAATHYARTILVGAYRVELLERGEDTGPKVGDERVEVEGTLEECVKKAKGARAPIPGCNVPIAYELRALELPRGQAKLHVSDTAGPLELPSPATMPRATGGESAAVAQVIEPGACAEGFAASAGPEADVRRLGEICAVGMQPVTGVLTGWQDERGEVGKYPVRLEAGRCYRVFGVGEPGVQDLDLGWYAPDGRLVARDIAPERWAMLGSSEVMCVEETGAYLLVVSVERGRGQYALQVWGRPR